MAGSKHLEPEEKYSDLYGKFLIVKWSYVIPFDTICQKLQTNVFLMVLSHSMGSKYKNSKNIFL